MSFDRREFIKRTAALLALSTPAVKLAETIETEEPRHWLAEAHEMEWFEGTRDWGGTWWITASKGSGEQKVTAPPVAIDLTSGQRIEFEEKMLAKRMIVEWFRDGGAERTIAHAPARIGSDRSR